MYNLPFSEWNRWVKKTWKQEKLYSVIESEIRKWDFGKKIKYRKSIQLYVDTTYYDKIYKLIEYKLTSPDQNETKGL